MSEQLSNRIGELTTPTDKSSTFGDARCRLPLCRIRPVTRADVVRVARGLIGVPFKHQGSDPATGIDCRGVLEYLALVLWGRRIPLRDYQRRPSGAEFLEKMRAELEEVPKEDARPGDAVLIHFPRDDEPRHGGVLAEGPYERMLIHAWESRGRGEVIEEPLRGWKLRNIDYAFRLPVAD